MHRLERIGLVGCVARHRRDLGGHVRTLGEREHIVERGEVLRLGDILSALEAEVIEHQLQAGIAFGHLVGEVHVLVMEQHHRGDAALLHLAPHPVELSVEQRLAQHRRMERETYAQHAGLLLPTLDHLTSVGRVRIEAAHGGEVLRVARRRLVGEIVAVAFPRRRHEDRAVDIGLFHLGQKLRGAKRLAMRFGAACRPRAFGRVDAPDVNLRVANHHGR